MEQVGSYIDKLFLVFSGLFSLFILPANARKKSKEAKNKMEKERILGQITLYRWAGAILLAVGVIRLLLML